MRRLVVLLTLVFSVPAFAASPRAIKGCNESQGQDAVTWCSQVIASKSRGMTKRNRASAYYLRAFAYTKLGQSREAIADCNEALKHHPNKAGIYRLRGIAYFNEQEYDRAVLDFSASLALKSDTTTFLHRGMTHFTLKKYDLAIDDFTEVLQKEELNLKARELRARAYARLKRDEEALGDILWANRLGTKDPVLHKDHGFINFKKKDYAAAIGNITDAIALDSKNKVYYELRAISYIRLLDFEKALADASTMITLDPADAKSYVFRGRIHKSLGKKQEAIRDFFGAYERGDASERVLNELRHLGFNIDKFLHHRPDQKK